MQLPIKEINGSKTQQIITTKKDSKKLICTWLIVLETQNYTTQNNLTIKITLKNKKPPT